MNEESTEDAKRRIKVKLNRAGENLTNNMPGDFQAKLDQAIKEREEFIKNAKLKEE